MSLGKEAQDALAANDGKHEANHLIELYLDNEDILRLVSVTEKSPREQARHWAPSRKMAAFGWLSRQPASPPSNSLIVDDQYGFEGKFTTGRIAVIRGLKPKELLGDLGWWLAKLRYIEDGKLTVLYGPMGTPHVIAIMATTREKLAVQRRRPT